MFIVLKLELESKWTYSIQLIPKGAVSMATSNGATEMSSYVVLSMIRYNT